MRVYKKVAAKMLVFAVMFMMVFACAGQNNNVFASESWNELLPETDQPVEVDKEWSIEFNYNIEKNSVNEDTIYVKDENNNTFPVGYEVEGSIVKLIPKQEQPYEYGTNYTIYIENTVESLSGEKMDKPIRMNFSTVEYVDKGIIEEGEVATVSTKEGFLYAVNQPHITTIQITKGFVLEEQLNITQDVVIIEGINDIVVDFSYSELSSLSIYGDNNTVENAVIGSLTIGDDVNNLTLENLQDTENSEHTFKGGGGESIKLLGNTTFKGDIKITTGRDIQIRAESHDAKIEGNLWVESDVLVKIAAPVSNVIVNSANSDVHINSKVDHLVVRNNATITLDSAVEKPKVEVRIGMAVTAKDETGQDVELNATYVLDTSLLERYIDQANDRYINTKVGYKNGQVSSEKKDELKEAIDYAQLILSTETEIDEDTQLLIDAQAKQLKEAIDTFVESIVYVEKYKLHDQIRRAEDIARSGQYSGEIYNELLEKIEEAVMWYNKDEVSQEEIDIQTQSLKDYIDTALVVAEGKISFIITGDLYSNEWIEVYLHQMMNEYSNWYYDEYVENYEIEDIDGGIKISIDYKGTSSSENSYITIRTSEYLFIEKLSSDEVKNGVVRHIQANDAFVPLQVSIPSNEEILDQSIALHVTNENGEGILQTSVGINTKIPVGTYNFQYNARTETKSYGLFKENVVMDNQSSTLTFGEDELVLVDIRLNQDTPVNYNIISIVPIHMSFNTIWHPRLSEDTRSIYLSKGLYNDISPVVVLENKDEFWRYVIRKTGEYNLQNDIIVEVNDNFKVDIEWNSEESVDIDTPLRNYINGYRYDYVRNDLGQTMDWVWKVELNQNSYGDWYRQIGAVNGTVVIKASGKEYSREVNEFRFGDITIRDIIGDANITGEVIIEFRVDSIPISIEPFIKVISIQGEEPEEFSTEEQDKVEIDELINEEDQITEGLVEDTTKEEVEDVKGDVEIEEQMDIQLEKESDNEQFID